GRGDMPHQARSLARLAGYEQAARTPEVALLRSGHFAWVMAIFAEYLLCPVTLDEDVGVIDGEDVAAEEGPAGGCRAGPLCACWRGDGQSDVTSVMAIRALASSTIALRSA